ncbi:MAG TPA: hypothetical protein V6C84_18060 [Coleofasciculaceae cyanobacterium]
MLHDLLDEIVKADMQLDQLRKKGRSLLERRAIVTLQPQNSKLREAIAILQPQNTKR